jgi:hypothetical protein
MSAQKKKTVTRAEKKTSSEEMQILDTIDLLQLLAQIIDERGFLKSSTFNALVVTARDKANRFDTGSTLSKTTARYLLKLMIKQSIQSLMMQ